jgi:hypothetical protein
MNAALPVDNRFAIWRRLGRANVLRVLAVCVAFVALPVVAIFYVREPVAVDGAGGMSGLGGNAEVSAASTGLAVGVAGDDPVAHFAQSRVGHILYSPNQGDYCRRVLFNNRTGVLYDMGSVLCRQSAPEAALVSGADRVQSLRKSFQK